MAAIVCHGLPSCLDHNLRLPSPKPLTSQPIDLPFKTCFWESNTKPHFEEKINKIETIKEDSWSSIQSLSKSNIFQGKKEQAYAHPNVKLSWQKLSPKSLELCTENLGNETGTYIPECNIDFLSSNDSSSCNLVTKEQRKISCHQSLKTEKVRTKNFPPPLKSMRGSESIRVKPHREDGRLVIELTKVATNVSCFQADRSNGRLRLSFWNDSEEDEENQAFEEDEEEEEKEEEVVEKEEGIDNENENENENGDTCVDEGIEIKCKVWNIGSEVRMENKKCERGNRRRCKEGKHENNEMLANWGEPLWLALATS